MHRNIYDIYLYILTDKIIMIYLHHHNDSLHVEWGLSADHETVVH